jgi:hypothetical protein
MTVVGHERRFKRKPRTSASSLIPDIFPASHRLATNRLNRYETRRIRANIAKPPELLQRCSDRSVVGGQPLGCVAPESRHTGSPAKIWA